MSSRLSQSGTQLTCLALQEAGIPVLQLDADMVDAKQWSRDAMVSHMESFLKSRGLV